MSIPHKAFYYGIAWAYPSSPSAKDFGKGETGCWVVGWWGSDWRTVGEDLAAFDTRDEAQVFADHSGLAIHPDYPNGIEQPTPNE